MQVAEQNLCCCEQASQKKVGAGRRAPSPTVPAADRRFFLFPQTSWQPESSHQTKQKKTKTDEGPFAPLPLFKVSNPSHPNRSDRRHVIRHETHTHTRQVSEGVRRRRLPNAVPQTGLAVNSRACKSSWKNMAGRQAGRDGATCETVANKPSGFCPEPHVQIVPCYAAWFVWRYLGERSLDDTQTHTHTECEFPIFNFSSLSQCACPKFLRRRFAKALEECNTHTKAQAKSVWAPSSCVMWARI